MNTQAQVPVLGKAIRILYELVDSDGAVSSSSLARSVDVSQPTCYRILKTLEAFDWIRPNDEKGYDLSLGLLPLTRGMARFDRYAQSIQPILDDLARDLELTAKLSVRVAAEQVSIGVAQPMRLYAAAAPVGTRYPVVLGASGAALLAALPDDQIEDLIEATTAKDWAHDSADGLRDRIKVIRKRHVCENLGNHPQGIDTISAPVVDSPIACAITLVGLRGDIRKGTLASQRRALLQAVHLAAKRIS